jgi:FixJ family two-component response regulator
MPVISGPELARQQTLRHPEMKVLFISGYADDTLINFGILNERTPFLEKPFTPEILLRKVRQLLDGDTMLNTA